jgi:uncharacterized protein (TIGR03437 family)
MAVLLVFLLAAAIGCAQPFVAPRGVLNAASYTPAGLPGGAIARGSMFSVFGQRLGPATPAQASSFPLGTTLAGVSVRITQGNTTVDALPVYVSAGQVNAIMPSNAPAGLVSLTVTFNGQRGNPSPVRVVNSSLGIFTATGTGAGPGIFQNFVSASDQPVNTNSLTAKPGQVVTLWGTGLGPALGPDNAAPTPGDLPVNAEVFVGGRPARRLYAGRSPCCSGIDQIVFEVPPDTPQGCWVPVHVRTEGNVTSNVTTLAIQPDGAPCSDAQNRVSERLTKGGKLGVVALSRARLLHSSETTADYLTPLFREEGGGPFAFHPMLSVPPPGTCTAFSAAGELVGPNAVPGLAATRLLNVGTALQFTGSRGSRSVTPSTSPLPFLAIGRNLPGTPVPNTLVLEADVAVQSTGGADVGAFRVATNMPSAFTWTNRDAVTRIDRTRELAIQWSGAPSGSTVAAVAISFNVPSNATTVVACVAAAEASSLSVPPDLLSKLPAAATGLLYVVAAPFANPVAFTAPGLDLGVAMPVTISGRSVAIQ